MDPTQPNGLPNSAPNFALAAPPPPSSGGGKTILWGLVAVLGIGAVSFGFLSVYAFNKASLATTTVNKQVTDAVTTARADQKAKDQQDAELANESPYRSYIAPIEYGSFEIKFPNNWSSGIDQSRSGQNQVVLTLHPDFLKTENGTAELAATKVLLVQRTMDEFLRQYTSQKTITRADTTVSGVKGVNLTGTFPDHRTTRIVVVPIRDKSLVFILEDKNFTAQYDQILAQSRVLP